REGLGQALWAACRRSAIAADVEADGIARYPPGLEAAVYFSCIEALQNAAKYAGSGAQVRVQLREETGALVFEVADNGSDSMPRRPHQVPDSQTSGIVL